MQPPTIRMAKEKQQNFEACLYHATFFPPSNLHFPLEAVTSLGPHFESGPET